MQIPARRQYIERVLRSEASVNTLELARTLHVSQETIRRDLIHLEREGKLRRVYGGAVTPTRQQSSEPPFAQRATENTEEKRVIGELCARLVRDCRTIFVDVGTTAQAAAKVLAPVFKGTVVSHSLLVAVEMANNCDAELILAPGRLRRGEWSLSGTATHNFIRSMHFDVALLSCGGVDGAAGATDFDFEDVEIKRTVASNSERCYILADASKHGVVGSYDIGDWYDIRGLVTGAEPPQGLASRVRAAGAVIVSPGQHRAVD